MKTLRNNHEQCGQYKKHANWNKLCVFHTQDNLLLANSREFNVFKINTIILFKTFFNHINLSELLLLVVSYQYLLSDYIVVLFFR